MLSSGTRIGHYQVESWIKEGSCGQSYRGQAVLGDEKGIVRYLKLFHRDLSEKEGFSDYFTQECRAIQQLEGRGIWPMVSSGIMKWKHWMAYNWFEGSTRELPGSLDEDESKEINLRSLYDWMEFYPDSIGSDELKAMMIDLHCGLNQAHSSGVIHGNLKPSNILISFKDDSTVEAWITEFALSKIASFRSLNEAPKDGDTFISQSLQFQDSLKESQKFLPSGNAAGGIPEEKSDLYALGALVQYVLGKNKSLSFQRADWETWAVRAQSHSFSTIVQSMEALPDIPDLSKFGIKPDHSNNASMLNHEEIRRRREVEWERKQKISKASFRRNITCLIGSLCVLTFLFSKIYLFLNPSPWVEYSMDGVSDKYQLGFGFLSGKAWGILPASYDSDGDGGQDVAGEWERVDGMFRLNFRKFKHVNDEESGKKLWQFIGKGSTSDDDYYAWSDYLSYNREGNYLSLIKRVHEGEVFVPGRRSDDIPLLFPEMRVRRSGGAITKTEIFFRQTQEDRPTLSIYIGLGFLLASFIYHKTIQRIPDL